MPLRQSRKSLITADRLRDLLSAKEQVIQAVAGKVPERLVMATAAVAVLQAEAEGAAADRLPERILQLVRASLNALAQHPWKADTALLLEKRLGGGDHGLSR